MATYLFPVQGLTVEVEWEVGPARLRPAAEALEELRTATKQPEVRSIANEVFKDCGAVVQVEGTDRDEALGRAAVVVDLLRVYQHVRYWRFPIGQFGLAGDLGSAALPYGQISGGRGGIGGTWRGPHVGWTFSSSIDWTSATVFRQVAAAIGKESASEGERRALSGLHYLSESLRDARPDFKMVALVTALEALLLPRRRGAQTFRLARALAFFGCGRHDDTLCGRKRDSCPYLSLKPHISAQRDLLVQLRKHGSAPPWLCSEWHRVVDWYDTRSDVVHGSGAHVDPKAAGNALYWTVHYLVEPILEWLTEHPHDPVQSLEAAIDALPPAPNWEARLGPLVPRGDA